MLPGVKTAPTQPLSEEVEEEVELFKGRPRGF